MPHSNSKKHLSHLPVVALIGRVNVGKSTLFNRLIEDQKAIVSDTPGTTRTRNEGIVLWRGTEFKIIDTGGLTFDNQVLFEEDIVKQADKAMKEADIIVLVTDAKTGPVTEELRLAKRLRRAETKSVILVANKADNKKIESTLTEPMWYKLGLGEPFAISSGSGRNVGNLLDVLYETLVERNKKPLDAEMPDETVPGRVQVSIIGKPNVGKSSLFNKLIGEDKVIVSDVPHTTREPHDTLISYKHKTKEGDQEQLINFVDTAGIRRKAKVDGHLERLGIQKSIDMLQNSDIILFVVDGSEPITQQDMQLGGLMERKSKSVIILINKWDLAEDNEDSKRNDVKRMVYSYFPHLDFAPILFVSSKTGYKVHDIFPLLMHVWEARHTHVANRGLEKFLEYIMRVHKPSRGKGTRQPTLMGMRQINEAPPVFEIFVKARTSLHRSYLDFVENKLREEFDFLGTPIVIKLTKMKK